METGTDSDATSSSASGEHGDPSFATEVRSHTPQGATRNIDVEKSSNGHSSNGSRKNSFCAVQERQPPYPAFSVSPDKTEESLSRSSDRVEKHVEIDVEPDESHCKGKSSHTRDARSWLTRAQFWQRRHVRGNSRSKKAHSRTLKKSDAKEVYHWTHRILLIGAVLQYKSVFHLIEVFPCCPDSIS